MQTARDRGAAMGRCGAGRGYWPVSPVMASARASESSMLLPAAPDCVAVAVLPGWLWPLLPVAALVPVALSVACEVCAGVDAMSPVLALPWSPLLQAARASVATPSVSASVMVVRNLLMPEILLVGVIIASCMAFAGNPGVRTVNS